MQTIYTDCFNGSDLNIDIQPREIGSFTNELIIEGSNTEIRLALRDGQLHELANALNNNGFAADTDAPEDATHFANKTWWCHIPEYNRLDKWVHGCWKMETGHPESLKMYQDYRSV